MKYSTLGLPILMTMLLLSIISVNGFIPENDSVYVYTFADVKNKNIVEVNNTVKITIVVKNLTNDTASNMTISQALPVGVSLLNFTGLDYSSDPINVTNYSFSDTMNDRDVLIQFLQVNEDNYTINLDLTLLRGENVGFSYFIKMTDEGSVTFQAPEVTYFDHWGDKNKGKGAPDLVITVQSPDEETRTKFIPEFETMPPNYTQLVGALVGLFIIVILSRVLYLKKPIEI